MPLARRSSPVGVIQAHRVLDALLPLAFAGLFASAAAAQPSGAAGKPGPSGPPQGWNWQAAAGYLWQDEAELDAGGAFETSVTTAEFGGLRFLPGGNRFGVAANYAKWNYDFSSAGAIGWDDVTTIGLSVPIQWSLGNDWRLIAAPSLSANYESGAELEDGLVAAGIIGASFQASPKLSIGPGLGVFGKLEDDATVIPILLIKWQFADAWSLESGRSLGATQRPGVFVNYEPDPRWRVQAGTRFESLDFRLSDSHAQLPDGAAEDESVGLFVASRYDLSRHATATFGIGYKLSGELKTWNAAGAEIHRIDYDNAFNAGFSFDFRW